MSEALLIKAVAATGGWILALVAVIFSFRAIMPSLLEFLSKRADARLESLLQREARVDKSLASRLTALERQLEQSNSKLSAMSRLLTKYYRATALLAAEVQLVAPNSIALSQVKELLEVAYPFPFPMDSEMDALVREAEEALDKGKSNGL